MSELMRRWSVACGTLKCTLIAETAYKAAKESLEFAKPDQELDDIFLVREVIVEDGRTRVCEDATISFTFEHIANAAGWEVS
jgi:hypothetical protein